MSLDFFAYGGDYNPEQWPASVWDEDARLMGLAHWNIATLPVFGWAALEPEEGRYTFEWLDEVLEKLHGEGVRFCLATATASVPAWLTSAYPDVLVVNEDGVKVKHGNRHTFCPHSPNFRRLSTALAAQLADRYGGHPGLAIWHISNEYGTRCYCEKCASAFRHWLKERYGSLDTLNERWWTRFWGKTYTDWDQIDTPTRWGEHAIQALRLDYWRFQSDSLLECFKAEKAELKRRTPNIPVTTNLMGPFLPLDYHRWAREMDVASWDNYPAPDADPSDVAFNHSLMRGLKEGQPFLLMEQSPSQQNWQPYNRLKPPGQLRLQSWQAIAQGADSVMYFQWRRGRGGIEKLHGAVLEHGGSSENRVFREVAALGEELARLGPDILGSRISSKVAVLFDWPSIWSLKLSSGPSKDLDPVRTARDFYGVLHRLGVDADVVSPKADLSYYDVIVAPLLTMLREPDAQKVVDLVRKGATLLATTFTGLVDDCDRVFLEGAPGPWSEVLGLSVEETDALPPGVEQSIQLVDSERPLPERFGASLLCDRVRLAGAEVLAVYTEEFYAGEPAVAVHRFGKGRAYYLATIPDAEGLRHILESLCREQGIAPHLGQLPPQGVETSRRVDARGGELLFLLNHATEERTVTLDGPRRDLLEGVDVVGDLVLQPREVRVLR